MKEVLLAMNIKNPFLYFQFNEEDQTDHSSPIYFHHPKKVIKTDQPNEVISCLKKIQQYIQNGYYAAGYLSYEASSAFYPTIKLKNNIEMPLLWFGIFDQPVQATNLNLSQKNYQLTRWKPTISSDQYMHNFKKVHQAIQQEKTEQVNYTIGLQAKFTGDSLTYFQRLKRAQNAQYNAYLRVDDYAILSASPELFFRSSKEMITVKPMKGTVHRGKSYLEDQQNKQWLQTSDKNRHENKIITELMYNELQKIAHPGSIQVTQPFAIEKYPTVYQMTSTIQAQLTPEKDILDIFKALYPCGSITGTKKEKTMQIINDLEEHPREVYCGAIGYITPEQKAIFSVPIRTVVINEKSGRAHFGVGGAITIHSEPEEEYKEILTKSELLTYEQPDFSLLESFGLMDGEYIVYPYHITRLKQSADFFSFPMNLQAIEQNLAELASKHDQGHWKVRLVVHKDGSFSVEINEIEVPKHEKVKVTLAKKPIDQNNVFLYHKTTNRDLYQMHFEKGFFDTLLWNEKREVTEFTLGNIVVKLGNRWVTPPVSCGLLAGTFREKLLTEEKINEAIITIEDLQESSEIWLINSVRKWIPVDLHWQ